jgi:hypothetical protein
VCQVSGVEAMSPGSKADYVVWRVGGEEGGKGDLAEMPEIDGNRSGVMGNVVVARVAPAQRKV